MTPEQEILAFEIFDEVCDLPEDQQADALASRRNCDQHVRRRVLGMLAQDAELRSRADGLPRGAGAQIVSSMLDVPDAAPGAIGAYRIIREVGRGGMGVVYEAEQENPRRRVALKVIRQGLTTRQMFRRFQIEAQVLALLDHPGIAHVYEAGSAPIGNSVCPYFAMEYVDGPALDKYIKEHAPPIRDRLELVARVCDAVQHAHQKGVIHRDLKPANILVKAEQSTVTSGSGVGTMVDAIGQPKILDFGVARATDADIQATTMQTDAGQIIGTLAYMSPEQIAGRSGEIDTRSDVYALGVVLFSVLTGRAPFDLHAKPIAEAARIVSNTEPGRPSSINPELKGDVDTIVTMAMEKDRDRRYDSAAALAEDIRRSLRDEPISAHPPSTFYQARKFAARNKVLVGGVLATFVTLLAGLVGMGVLLARVEGHRKQTEEAARRTSAVAEFQQELLAGLHPRETGALIGGSMLQEFERALDDQSAASLTSDDLAGLMSRANTTNVGREVLSGVIVDRSIEMLDGRYSDDPLAEAQIRRGLNNILRKLARPEEAVEQARIALDIHTREQGARAYATVDAQMRLGRSLYAMREFEEAERVLREAIQIVTEEAGARHRLSIRGSTRLGALLRETGRLEESEELLLRTLANATEIDSKSLTASAHNELGVLCLEQGRFADAVEYFEHFLGYARDQPDSELFQLIRATNNVMAGLFREGRFQEAEAYARDSVRLHSIEYGDEHPQAINARNNLARVLLDTGKVDEAGNILESVYELSQRALPVGNNMREATATNYIDACVLTGRVSEGKAAADRLLQERRASGVVQPGAIAQTLEQLGECHLELSQYREAEESLLECIELRESIDADHWLTHRGRTLLGVALHEQGRIEEARELLVNGAAGIERKSDDISLNMRDRELRRARERAALANSAGR